MKQTVAGLVSLTVLVVVAAAPVLAEHLTQTPEARPPAPPSTTLDLDLKIGKDGFRLGGRVLGQERVHGAWVNGQIRPDGITVDGRLQNDGRAYNFKLNAELIDALARGARWWLFDF